MVRSPTRIMCALTLVVTPSETQFLQSFTSSFSVSSWSSSGTGRMIERSWSSSPLGGSVEHVHEVSSAVGGKVLQDVRSELVEDTSGAVHAKMGEVRCIGSLCEESLSIVDPSSVHGPAASGGGLQPHERPMIASGWRLPSMGGQAVPCHQAVSRVARTDGGVPAMAAGDDAAVAVTSQQNGSLYISPEEICGIAVGLALCGTALVAFCRFACRGCRRKRPAQPSVVINEVPTPPARLRLLSETPTSLLDSRTATFFFEEDLCNAYVLRLYAREAEFSQRREEEAFAH